VVRGFKTLAEKHALEFRRQLGLKPHEFLCGFKLADHLQVPVFVPNDFPMLEDQYKNNLLGIGSDNWSAVTIPIDNKYIIIHNNMHSPTRQQSNLMHELAHIICKHSSPVVSISNIPSLRNYNANQEDEAIWLGGCLQLPRPLLIYYLKRNINTKNIANLNSASEDMVNYRIKVTGVRHQVSYNRV
jgi:hypothetical protein